MTATKAILAIMLVSIVSTAHAQDGDVTKSCWLKACELTGDFNGDGYQDTATLVENSEHKKGIQVVFGKVARTITIGAGNTVGNSGDDLSWVTSWTTEKHNFRRPGSKGAAHPIVLVGAALHLERGSPISYVRAFWNGSAFLWNEVNGSTAPVPGEGTEGAAKSN